MTETRDPIFSIPSGLPRLRAVMERLRDPESGCPWDIQQDFSTIAPYTIEEAYEVADAIEREDWDDLEGELGDLLLQVIYHGQMASEAGHFDLDGIILRITDKMIERHPHVFGSESRDKSAEDQTRDWEAAKAAERSATGRTGVLDDVALGLPALMRAVKLQKRAARVGFDWPDATSVLDKITEETAELVDAGKNGEVAEVHEEYGDLLFVMANLARHLDIDPEAALRDANAKFTQRFRWIEAALAREHRSPEDSTLAEMDALWNASKAKDKARSSSENNS